MTRQIRSASDVLTDSAPRAGVAMAQGLSVIALSVVVLIGLASGVAAAQAEPGSGTPLASIPATTYAPFYPIDGEGDLAVAAFELQILPVTNADYLAFVREHPTWARGDVPEVFVEDDYLAHWSDPDALGDADPDAPVTNVSWFAAGAYCDAAGLRLPSESEWEVAARADPVRTDASDDPARRIELLAAYGGRGRSPATAGASTPNAYGVHDLHELVWEWVEDPWSNLAAGDSRSRDDRDVARVCGGASLGARDRNDYPAFMRHAFRTGLDPATAASSLGFRCAR